MMTEDEKYRKYVMENYFIKDFWSKKNGVNGFRLQENAKGGASELYFKVQGENSVAICNIDQKNTSFNFFIQGKTFFLQKRVDHVVLESQVDGTWVAHLIEMKSSVSTVEKWLEIKAKFRASYLCMQAICAMLHMKIGKVCMYTTYENVTWKCLSENMISRKTRVGEKLYDPPRVVGRKFSFALWR